MRESAGCILGATEANGSLYNLETGPDLAITPPKRQLTVAKCGCILLRCPCERQCLESTLGQESPTKGDWLIRFRSS